MNARPSPTNRRPLLMLFIVIVAFRCFQSCHHIIYVAYHPPTCHYEHTTISQHIHLFSLNGAIRCLRQRCWDPRKIIHKKQPNAAYSYITVRRNMHVWCVEIAVKKWYTWECQEGEIRTHTQLEKTYWKHVWISTTWIKTNTAPESKSLFFLFTSWESSKDTNQHIRCQHERSNTPK